MLAFILALFILILLSLFGWTLFWILIFKRL